MLVHQKERGVPLEISVKISGPSEFDLHDGGIKRAHLEFPPVRPLMNDEFNRLSIKGLRTSERNQWHRLVCGCSLALADSYCSLTSCRS